MWEQVLALHVVDCLTWLVNLCFARKPTLRVCALDLRVGKESEDQRQRGSWENT